MALRILLRGAVVLCLLVAAAVVGAGAGEYPGLTRAGLRFAAEAVVPLLVVAVVNLAALDGGGLHAARLRALALAANVALLAAALSEARRGAPPVTYALVIVGSLLVVCAAGLEVMRRRAPRAPRVAP